ncbi:alpha/beta fold hydrolase, partial [Xanthovirga aplysinae]|uniref:alpha/beta fold hydrolase n=1 Tax=Xanthovirga aplysinae TaxID=2529853 RepID=UPI00165748CA
MLCQRAKPDAKKAQQPAEPVTARRKMKIIISVIIALSLTGCSTKGQERFVDINDSKFHIKEYGKGSPTVIFENGMASSMDTWKSIPDSISSMSNVLTYDRAGVGKSDTTFTARTIPNMVKELRHILKKEKIRP